MTHQELKEGIALLVKEFQKTSGFVVSGIDIEMADASTPEKQQFTVSRVLLHIQL